VEPWFTGKTLSSKFPLLATAVFSVCMIGTVCFSLLPQAIAQATTHNITLYGSASQGWGFTQQSMSSPGPTINFQIGEQYNITLISADGLPHQFYVDYNRNGILDATDPSSQTFSSTTNIFFTPDRTGDFPYYCSIHPGIMRGNVAIVPELTPTSLLILLVVMSLVSVVCKNRSHAKTNSKTTA
jgi:plastocyanin